MNLVIAAVGRMKTGPEKDLFTTYAKRLNWRVELKEVEERRPLGAAEVIRSEGNKLLAALPDNSWVVALDRTGAAVSSEGLAQNLEKWIDLGRPSVTFVIGGADGLDTPVLERADARLSFGDLTWPHMLVRVMLMEQLYRAQCILGGHPYHK